MKNKIFYVFEGNTISHALIKKLLLMGNTVYYVSNKRENIQLIDGLKAFYSSLEIIEHDPTDYNWIKNIEMSKKVGAVIILSSDDALNFVISWMMRSLYDDLHIISLINHSENEFMFKKMNINTLSPTLWMEKLIESSLNYEDITDFFNPYVEKLSIVELLINENDISCNKKLKELSMPSNSIIGVIVKENNNIMVPQGNTEIESGDKLIVFALKEQVNKVKEALK